MAQSGHQLLRLHDAFRICHQRVRLDLDVEEENDDEEEKEAAAAVTVSESNKWNAEIAV